MVQPVLVEGRVMGIDEALDLASQYVKKGQLQLAEQICDQIIRVHPSDYRALNTLGQISYKRGKDKIAESIITTALANNPDYADGHYCLGNVLYYQGRVNDAVASYKRAISLKPDFSEAYNYLGNALLFQGKVDEARTNYLKALTLDPGYAEAHNNIGNIFSIQGKIDDAVASYRKALDLKPELTRVHSNILLSMNYSSAFTAREIYFESREWEKKHGNILAACRKPHANSRNRDRRLRIGYLSPDFCNTSVSYFCEPLFAAHDRDAVELFCYADVPVADATTLRLQKLTDRWLRVIGLTDEALFNQIRDDRIDILVDLAGHTARNRLPIFAAKPAPVQVTWLGYPNTTGLSAIDYRLTDVVADPEGEADELHAEKLYRLPDGFLCYAPPPDTPQLSPPPVLKNGYITFGSFNNLVKLTPDVIALWSRVLHLIPGSRLVLKNRYVADPSTRLRYLDMIHGHGIGPGRIDLLPQEPSFSKHLAMYGCMDISLDPFPYNGTTTTCESLWMGVPVVTLQGDRHAGRVGASILSRTGHAELVAHSLEEYKEISVKLAGNPELLATIRKSLRREMTDSPLCDAKSFARNVETAYREMWQQWCCKTGNK